MKTLKAPYDFATAGNYPAGAFLWSGLPRIVALTTTAKANGFTPDQPIPAETVNYLENLKAEALAVQVHSALQCWTPIGAIPNNGINNNILTAMSVPGLNHKRLFAFEPDSTHAGNAWWSVSNEGSLWSPKAGMSPAFANLIDVCAGLPGQVLLVRDSSEFQYTTNYGVSWTNVGFGPTNALAAHFGLGQYWYCNKSQIATANALASLGSATLISVPLKGTGFLTGLPEFADNLANTICLLAQESGGTSPTYPSVWTSTNGGTSWVRVADFMSATAANIQYDPILGLFVVWDNTGAVSTSSDGITWALGTALTGSPSAGVSAGPRSLAIAGPAIVKTWSESIGGLTGAGVAYSFDLGSNWFVTMFGSNPLAQLLAVNGRIYASDGDRLYASGLLTAHDRDF